MTRISQNSLVQNKNQRKVPVLFCNFLSICLASIFGYLKKHLQQALSNGYPISVERYSFAVLQKRAKAAINYSIVEAYWRTGKKVYEPYGNNSRAEYGKRLLSKVSEKLVGEFEKGFGTSNLRNMRRFYLTYQKRDTVCSELSWSQYRFLMRVHSQENGHDFKEIC